MPTRQGLPAKVYVEQITPEQGLPSHLVSEILQDRSGFLWFGTIDGLARYDGYEFKVYKPQPGDSNSLSAHHINMLFEDSFGDLWINAIGEQHRLDRISRRISRVLTGRWHTSVCEDTSRGRAYAAVWLATLGHGIYRWDRGNNSYTQFVHDATRTNTLGSDSVLSLFMDTHGTLWIGTMAGLNALDADREGVRRYPTGPRGHVQVITTEPLHTRRVLWIGADDGLYRFNADSNTFHRYRNRIATGRNQDDNDVRTLFWDSRGTLWVGMVGGIARFSLDTRSFTSYQNDVGAYAWAYANKSWLFQEDLKGTLWSLAHGSHSSNPLRCFDPDSNRWVGVRGPSGFPLFAYSLCIDRTGSIWLGTLDAGVLKIDAARKPFFTYLSESHPSPGGTPPVISGIAEDSLGDVWLGSDRGVFRFDPLSESITHYTHSNRNPRSLSLDEIGPLLGGDGGSMWIGTRGGGVDYYDPRSGTFQHHIGVVRDPNTLSSNDINSLARTHEGTLWVGSSLGTLDEYSLEHRTFRRHGPPKVPFSFATLMFGLVEDPDGLLWYILRGAGVVCYNPRTGASTVYPGAPEPYSGPVNLSTIGLSALALGRAGDLWIGSNAGLIRFDRQSGRSNAITENDGLANQFVTGIVEDSRGFLWLSTTKGISKYNPYSGQIWNYDDADGVHFGGSIRTTGCKTRNGEIYFGGSRGFVRFHPDSIRANPHIPHVVITGFRKFGHPVDFDTTMEEKKSITLSFDDKVFAFEFAALNYTGTVKNQYAYKLEGFNRDWILIGDLRTASFTNLDGGTYVFRVKGSNNDGVWNDDGTSLVVIIAPPFWQTWWFRIAVFLALLAIVGGTIRYVEITRLRRRMEVLARQQEVERERVRIAGDLHDELASNLTSIAMLSRTLHTSASTSAEERAQSTQLVERIAALSIQSVDSIRDIIWAIDSRDETLDGVLTRLRDSVVGMCRARGIRLSYSAAAGPLPSSNLQPEIRRNLWMFLKEAVHNAIKHSGCNELMIEATYTDGTVRIAVKDNGKGFDTDARSVGKGLRTMTMRAEKMNATIHQRSGVGEGTCISLEFRLSQ